MQKHEDTNDPEEITTGSESQRTKLGNIFQRIINRFLIALSVSFHECFLIVCRNLLSKVKDLVQGV